MNRRDLLKGFLGLPVAGVLAKVGLHPPEPETDDLLTRDWDDDDEWDDEYDDGDVEYSDDWQAQPATSYSCTTGSWGTFTFYGATSSARRGARHRTTTLARAFRVNRT